MAAVRHDLARRPEWSILTAEEVQAGDFADADRVARGLGIKGPPQRGDVGSAEDAAAKPGKMVLL
jgi:hypothetical protein